MVDINPILDHEDIDQVGHSPSDGGTGGSNVSGNGPSKMALEVASELINRH